MQGLIGDLLDAGRIHAGTLSVDPEAVEVASLVEQREDDVPGRRGPGERCASTCPPDLPRVMADERRIVQVLEQPLIGNAARHAPESSSIQVGAVHDGVHVAISVSDEGRGVSPEQLPHLFRKYADVGGGDRAPDFGGVGLGLTICKGLVEAHGGRIRAESAGLGRGTTFTFTVPVADEPAHGAAAGASGGRSRRSRDGREQTRILVVDDDPEMLRYVRDALAEAGYTPVVTGESDELPDLIRRHRPALVLLDLMLPGTDGLELMQRVPKLADLPVIFISAYGRDETIARALEAGAADYLVKPFSAAELVARVRAALRGRAGAEPFVLGDLAIDYEQRRVTMAGRPVELTLTEYELLRTLSVNAGRVVTYDSLLRDVWGERGGDAKHVRTYVKRLRRKLGDDVAKPSYILTARGLGYRMGRPEGTARSNGSQLTQERFRHSGSARRTGGS